MNSSGKLQDNSLFYNPNNIEEEETEFQQQIDQEKINKNYDVLFKSDESNSNEAPNEMLKIKKKIKKDQQINNQEQTQNQINNDNIEIYQNNQNSTLKTQNKQQLFEFIKVTTLNDFYNQKKQYSKLERSELDTSKLRQFNNWIKAVLIQKYTEKAKAKLKSTDRIAVLDLGCGKGGDLNKWIAARTGMYVGMDISSTAVQDAQERLNKINNMKFKGDNKNRQILRGIFIEQDITASEKEFFNHIDQNLYFDICSSQLSFHYIFENEEKVRRALCNISSKLLYGGYFILTIPDANVIVKRLRALGKKNQSGQYVFGNGFYSIQFDQKKFPKEQKYFNYGFYLKEAIGKEQYLTNTEIQITYINEFLVEFNNFVNLAALYRLELVEDKNFLDFYEENRSIKAYQDLFQKVQLTFKEGEQMNHELWQISHLYKIAAFKKVSGVKQTDVDRKFYLYKQQSRPIKKNEGLKFY